MARVLSLEVYTVIMQINLSPLLSMDWHAKVERQLNFVLASLHWQIVQLEITLSPAHPEQAWTAEDPIKCRLTAKLRGGRREEIAVYNKDPMVCVGDAAARLRRVIARDRQLGLLGRAS
jgi:hypothetical protein